MFELPMSMRVLLVEQLNDYCRTLDETADVESIAESVVEYIESVCQEVSQIEAEEIVQQLEEASEQDSSLVEIVEDGIRGIEPTEYSGEFMVDLLEKVCEIEWQSDDDEEGGAGFFSDDGGIDDDDF